jgi:hypothetical protein
LSSDEITITQIRNLDIATIRPGLLSLLGRDSTGLDAVSMIITYEDFLASQYPLDTTHESPPEALTPDRREFYIRTLDQEYARTDPAPCSPPPFNPTITKNPKTGAPPHRFLQLLHQQGKMWIGQLNDFHDQYYKTNNIAYAKKGVAAGYNALLSGPTLNEIQKIEDKLLPLIDTLQSVVKKNR